jgi:ATP adenylyltransferase
MSMSHVYQPLLVRALVDAGGTATVRQLAQAFLVQDESQLLYYEKRIKEMPLKVLKRHEVITSDGQLVQSVRRLLSGSKRRNGCTLCALAIESRSQTLPFRVYVLH